MVSSNITLRDGRTVHLRPTEVADEAELLQTYARMSDDARYMRLMHAAREPNLERGRGVLASFPERGIGVVATVPAADGIDIVASSIAIFDSERTGCEFAITVDAAFGRTGLATALMAALIGEARRAGLQRMEGFVLSQNQPMLRLARRLGFSVSYDPDDASVRIVRLALQSP